MARRRPRAHALAPVALSLALGLWGVRREGSLWRDEAVTYDMARRGLPQLGRTLERVDAVHGLYYLLMHGLFRVFAGADPLLVLRLPSVLAVAAAAGTLALLGHRLAGPRAGLLSGVVFALLPPVQRYAQEGRSYALVCALVVWASYLLVRAVESRTRRAWVAYAAVLLAGCLLHEFAVLVLAAHAVAVPRAARRAWARAALAVAVGVAAPAAFSVGQSEQVAWIGGIGAGALVGFAGVTALGIACAALLPRGRSAGRVGLVPLALPLFVLPGLLLLLVSLVKPLYVDRYVLYGQAGTALLAGAALDRLARAGGLIRAGALLAAGAAVAALLPVTLHLRTPQSRVDDVTAVAAAVRAAAEGADGVLYLPARRRVWSLVDPDSVRGPRDLALDRGPADSGTLYGTEVAPSVVRSRVLAARRIVVLRDPAGQPVDATPQEAAKRRLLAEHFEECGTRAVLGARVSVYARPGRC
ncbi:glycosyltransferase family 39 protein [Streptomyces sp. NPDC058252]|uniref:glycosyltransferase family 39 protein n=1 Tax=Streptomyces sp. NPDC058252 TaxID=3346405 RepID=UPI0036E0D98A